MLKRTYYIGDLLPIFQDKLIKEELESIDKNVFFYAEIPESEKKLHNQFNRELQVNSKIFGCIMIEYIDNIHANLSNGIIANYYDNFMIWKSQQRILFGTVCVELF